jgi:molybdenum cofactor cytidylyltransferase
MLSEKKEIAVLILAAGSSSRLGFPKQLVKLNKKFLLEIFIEEAIKTEQDVFVVLGASKEVIKNQIQFHNVFVVENVLWEQGIGSSISIGVEAITKQKRYDGILIMLCDQILINFKHLSSLINRFSQNQFEIIATGYNDQAGVPAVFSSEYFIDLQNLDGNSGAKIIIQKHKKSVSIVEFQGASIDVDTQDDIIKNNLDIKFP